VLTISAEAFSSLGKQHLLHWQQNASCACGRFIVPDDKIPEFEDAWHEREATMQQLPGFKGFTLERQDDSSFVATSRYVFSYRVPACASLVTGTQCALAQKQSKV